MLTYDHKEHPLTDAWRLAEMLIHSGVRPTINGDAISLDWSGENKAHKMNRAWVRQQIASHGPRMFEAIRWIETSGVPVASQQIFRFDWPDLRNGMLEDGYRETGGPLDKYVRQQRPEVETSRIEHVLLHPDRIMVTLLYRAGCSGRLWSSGECVTTLAGHVRVFLPFETTRAKFARLDGQTITFGVGDPPFSIRCV